MWERVVASAEALLRVARDREGTGEVAGELPAVGHHLASVLLDLHSLESGAGLSVTVNAAKARS
jgi:hypothetical protein